MNVLRRFVLMFALSLLTVSGAGCALFEGMTPSKMFHAMSPARLLHELTPARLQRWNYEPAMGRDDTFQESISDPLPPEAVFFERAAAE